MSAAKARAGDVTIYRGPGGEVEVRISRDSVWLNLNQMAGLFGRDKSVISRHLRNVYREGELEEAATVANFATVQTEGRHRRTRQIEYFNLDAILSVGYRVNSKQGTRFRQWATRTLNEHLTRGYTIQRQRFEQNAKELEATLALVRKAADSEALRSEEGRGLVDLIARYTQTFLLLGEDSPQNRSKRSALDAWVKAVSGKGGFGVWCADVAYDMAQIHDILQRHAK